MINLPPMRKDRTLLATVTGEPFQPARLYYAIPSKTVVARIFRQMHCMDEDADNDRWVWRQSSNSPDRVPSFPIKSTPSSSGWLGFRPPAA